ncbi:hypothetical protein FYJ24_07815 [Actinomycetaceae bacterium WB03_NA08]|uniref:Uncharacterized protein n=1 Tax=Scrofimicrobium canadense TaxID=2652290 RepID=A0A6N7W5J2_9ACTO|nr:DUF5979 domain-containing protein [Scrofimicrobium canadense]MSS84671.1 hypothetical protein [Scrofimicrobium canadense]
MKRIREIQSGGGLRGLYRAVFATIVSAALIFAGVVAPGTMAHAAEVDAGNDVTLHFPDEVFNEGIEPGTNYTFSVDYGFLAQGSTATITPPAGVKFPDSVLVVPAGNKEIASIERDGENGLKIVFKDTFSPGFSQGYVDLNFSIDNVEKSEKISWPWTINGQSTPITITVLTPGDKYVPVITENSLSKRGDGSLGNATVEDGVVILPEGLKDKRITYTVTVKSAEARTVTLTDTLDSDLELVGPLTGTKETRDSEGLNYTKSEVAPVLISGTGFTHTFEAEANSTYTFTYQAKVADLEGLQQRLQEAYDNSSQQPGSSFSVKLNNTVVDGDGKTGSHDTWFGGNVPSEPVEPQPAVDDAFKKSSDLPSPYVTIVNEDGTLPASIPVTYTLNAKLSTWADFEDSKYALTTNVVITDTLPDQTSWTGTVSATGIAGHETLQRAPEGVTAEQLAGDDYVGMYLLEGKTLIVNVGKDTSSDVTVTAGAQIDTLQGLSTSVPGEWESNQGEKYVDLKYEGLKNRASFAYNDKTVPREVTHTIYREQDPSKGVVDGNKFSKTAEGLDGGKLTLVPGEPASLTYKFTVNAGFDAAKSTIIDYVDHSVFDVSERTLPAIKESITGKYHWNYPLDKDSFDVAIDADGNLVLTPKAGNGFPHAASWGATAEAPYTQRFEVSITLPLKLLQGKQSITVSNKATYQGTDEKEVFVSESVTKASSFGSEMEVRKRVTEEGSADFTTNLRAVIDEDTGELIKDKFIYRVDLIPHGSFNRMVRDVVDELPAGMNFLGFLNESQVSEPEVPSTNVSETRVGNLAVNYDVDANSITVAKGSVEEGKELTLYFAVQISEYSPGIGINNVIGRTGAIITPTGDYPLNISKVDSSNAAVDITDREARFNIMNADGEVVVADAYVVDGKLKVKNADTGEDAVPTVKEPGTYTVEEIKAPAGYQLATEPITVVVDENGRSEEVKFYNDPGETPETKTGTFSVQKLVEVADGDQAANEAATEALKDVEYTITASWEGGSKDFTVKPGGEPVVLEPELPVGTEVVFSESLKPNAETPGYQWVKGALMDGNTQLTDSKLTIGETEEPVALTVVNTYTVEQPKTYAIGDVVWVDTHADVDPALNGNQGDDEGDSGVKFLEGVKVSLLDAEGNPVEGVEPTYTNKDGRYIFDNLPAGEYVVHFELTDEQKARYQFTTANKEGVDPALKSDADVETGKTQTIVLNDENTQLVKDSATYEAAGGIAFTATEGIDPTWDAGVVLIPTTPEPEPEVGTFQLQKVVSGVAEADLADKSFEVTATWTADGKKQEQKFQLPANGEKVAGPEVPVGTVVSILEQADREIPGYNYTGTTLSGDGVTESSVTVGTDKAATVTVTNTYEEEEPPAPEPEVGLVSLSKVVVGLDEGESAGDHDFVFSWSAVAPEGVELGDVPAQGSVTVKGDAVPVVVSDADGTPVSFPAQTVVTFEETEPAQIEGYSFNAEVPVFAEGAGSVTVVKDETVNAVATNTYTKNTSPEPTDPNAPTGPKTPAKETPEPKKPTEKLAVTGATIGWLAAAAAALLLGGGVAVTTVRTKRLK